MDIAKRWIDAGKLMIFVLSAVAEIEREDIRTQTMAGVEQIEEWNSWLSNESIATRKSRIRNIIFNFPMPVKRKEI